MIKAAAVGLGWWSDELAKSIQRKSKKIKIVSCYSRSKKKRINFSKKFNIQFHDSYNELIIKCGFDFSNCNLDFFSFSFFNL